MTANKLNIEADNTTIFRAMEVDVDMNHSEMLDSIAMMFNALRDGDDKGALLMAKAALWEYDELSNRPEFDANPVRELVAAAISGQMMN